MQNDYILESHRLPLITTDAPRINITPTTLGRLICSLNSITPSTVATTGSMHARIDAVALVVFFRPVVYRIYGSKVASTISPRIGTMQVGWDITRAGIW